MHGVLADHRAAAQRREADVAALARAGMAVADADRVLGEVDAAALRRGAAEEQRRARRRIDLVAVMHLDDLDVEIGVERLRRLADEDGEEVDAEAHVAGLDDRRMARRRGDLRLVVGGQAGRADDMDDARLRGELGEGDGRGGRGEVEDAVGLGEGRERIVGERDAVRREAGEFAGILADLRRARRARSRRRA